MNRFRARPVVVVMMLGVMGCCAGVPGCGGGSDYGTPPPPSGGTEIGPSGGAVVSSDGRIMAIVPAGALDHTVTVTVEPAAVPPAGALPGTTYDLGPNGTQFAVPVGLTLHYDPADVPSGSCAAELRLARVAATLWVPLADSSVDSVGHTLTATTTHFSIFGVTATGNGGDETRTAYLRDAPAAGAEDQFATLTAAMAWLAARLGYEDEGVIVWQTSTPQAVASLSFAFDLRVEVASGFTAILQGPTGSTLVVDAIGAVDLNAFSIIAPGGFTLNANRSLTLAGCTLPDGTTLNIGGVGNALFPAGGAGPVAKSAAASARSKGATVCANSFGAGATVAFVAAPVAGNYDLTDNTGQDLLVTGPGGIGGTATVTVSNPIPYPDFALPMQDGARLVIKGNKLIRSASLNGTLTGNPFISIEGNEGGSFSGMLTSSGTLKIAFQSHTVRNNSFSFSAPIVIFEGQDVEADRLAATVQGHDLSWTQSGVSLAQGLELDAGAVTGDLTFDSSDDVYGGDIALTVPAGAHPTVSVRRGTLTGARFLIGPQEPKRTAGGGAEFPAGGGVNLEDLTWSGEGTDHVEISGLDVPVTISGCSLTHSGELGVILGLTGVGGAISITDSEFQGGGIGLVDCTGAATIDGCDITIAGTTAYGVSLGQGAETTIRNTDITCNGGLLGLQAVGMNGPVTITGCHLDAAGAALGCFFGQSTVNLDDNPLVSGQIILVASQVHMSGNTFAAAQVVDDWNAPGLQNDPVADNDGLAPDDVATRRDWDGNGCCDYPPDLNVRDEYGNCPCDGVGDR